MHSGLVDKRFGKQGWNFKIDYTTTSADVTEIDLILILFTNPNTIYLRVISMSRVITVSLEFLQVPFLPHGS